MSASSPLPIGDGEPATLVWTYFGDMIFNMLTLVGAVKMADRLEKEMMSLQFASICNEVEKVCNIYGKIGLAGRYELPANKYL